MNQMIELLGTDREVILKLCKGREDDVTLYSCIDGNLGRVWVDDYDNPGFAFALIGDFGYVMGKYIENYMNDITELMEDQFRNKIMLMDECEWNKLIEWMKKSHSKSYRSFSRYAVKGKSEWFDAKKLQEYAKAVEPEFKVIRIDEEIYHMTQKEYWTEDFCSNFHSLTDYLENGMGYVVLVNKDIIAGASSYSYCQGKIEITIETKEEYRRKGLALACASKLILECLEKGIYPRWDAANLNSVALATKLGYQFDKEYTVYYI